MKTIGFALLILGAAFGAWFAIESRMDKYTSISAHNALAEEVKKVDKKVDFSLGSIQIEAIERRIWIIKERHGETPKDKTVKEELGSLEEKKKKVSEALEGGK